MNIENTYEICKSQTERPGKFEGESPLTVFIYNESFDGCLEDLADVENDGHYAAKIKLTASEMEEFKTDISEWVLIEDSQGFCFSIPASKYDSWKN